MKRSAILRAEALDRVSEYFAGTPPWTVDTPAPAKVAVQRQVLDDARAAVRAHATTQASGHNTERHQGMVVTALRHALRDDHLVPIRRIARVMMPEHPGVVHQFAVPPKWASTARMLQAARQIVRDVAPYTDAMIASGRPTDFLDRLNAAVASLDRAVMARATAAGTRSGGSAGIPEALRRGSRAVQYLDAIMRSCFGHNPKILTQWRQAKRVRLNTAPAKVDKGVVTSTLGTEEG